MKIYQHDIERAHGTLTLDLADGRTGELKIDFDLSAPGSEFSIENLYDEESYNWIERRSLSGHYATMWSLTTMAPQPDAPVTIKLPTGDKLDHVQTLLDSEIDDSEFRRRVTRLLEAGS